MKITVKVDYKNLTVSGKPSLDFVCEHCRIFAAMDAFFWNSAMPKDNLEEALTKFTDMINKKAVESLYPSKKTGKKLLVKLCHCDPKIIQFDYIKGVRRAKEILETGKAQLRQKGFSI